MALDHVVRGLEARGLPHPAGIALVLLAWAAVLVGVVLAFIPPLSSQLGALIADMPKLLARLRESDAYAFLERHLPSASVASVARTRAKEAVSSAVAIATAVLGTVAGLVTVYFIVAFMLSSGGSLVRAWLALPRQPRRWFDTAHRIYGALGGYVIGVMLIVAINAGLTSTFLGIVGVPWFLPLGLFSGIASLVPYVGALSAGVLLTVVAWASNGLWAGVATLAYYLVYQQVENHFIAPIVYRRTVQLNALVILLSALVLGEVFGIAGAVLAVPIAATAQIVVRELLRSRSERLDPDAPRGGRSPGRPAPGRHRRRRRGPRTERALLRSARFAPDAFQSRSASSRLPSNRAAVTTSRAASRNAQKQVDGAREKARRLDADVASPRPIRDEGA